MRPLGIDLGSTFTKDAALDLEVLTVSYFVAVDCWHRLRRRGIELTCGIAIADGDRFGKTGAKTNTNL